MRRIFFLIFLVISVSMLLSCKKDKKKDTKWQDTTTSGIIPIAADESFEPFISQEVDIFENRYKKAVILPIYTNESEAVRLLLEDSVRMAVVSRDLTEQERAYVAQRQMVVRKHTIAIDAVALIINKENRDSLLSVSTLKKILTGEITEWKEINPKSPLGKIEVMFDQNNSSTVRYAVDSICRDKPLSDKLFAQRTNMEVVDMVSKHPNSLGIVGVNWISDDTDSTFIGFQNKIRVMAISKYENATPGNSYQPYQGNMAMGDYPLTREVYVLLSDPKSGLSSGFTTFIMNFVGQRMVYMNGLLPATQPIRLGVNIVDEYPK